MSTSDSSSRHGAESIPRPVILVLSRDLFFPSSLPTAAGAEFEVKIQADPAVLKDPPGGPRPTVVLLDLDSFGDQLSTFVPQVIAQFPASQLIGFGSHVHTARLELAKSSGCHAVVTRGKLHQSVRLLLREWCDSAAAK